MIARLFRVRHRFNLEIFLLILMLVTPCLAKAADAQSSTADLPFKRLFTTPEQRQTLDYWRRSGGLNHSQVSGTDEGDGKATSEPIFNPTKPIKLSGILLRADGHNTVWLNGSNESQESENYAHRIRGNNLQSATVKVPLLNTNSGAILKPGQVWIPNDQRVEEAYQLPQTKVITATPAPVTPITPAPSQPASAAVQSSSTNTSEMSSNAKPKASYKP